MMCCVYLQISPAAQWWHCHQHYFQTGHLYRWKRRHYQNCNTVVSAILQWNLKKGDVSYLTNCYPAWYNMWDIVLGLARYGPVGATMSLSVQLQDLSNVDYNVQLLMLSQISDHKRPCSRQCSCYTTAIQLLYHNRCMYLPLVDQSSFYT